MLMSVKGVQNQSTVSYLGNLESSDQKPNFSNRFRADILKEQTDSMH